MSITDLVVGVLPEVEREQLEGREHGPAEVVEARDAVVGVLADATQTRVVGGAVPAHSHVTVIVLLATLLALYSRPSNILAQDPQVCCPSVTEAE